MTRTSSKYLIKFETEDLDPYKKFSDEASLSALKLFHDSIKTREDRLRRCVQSLERLLFDSAESLRELPSLRESNCILLHRLTLWNSYWETRELIKRRHGGSSIEGLLSQVAGQQNPLKESGKH